MSRKKQDVELDPDKPLFMHKSNPNRDYDQWAMEYDTLEIEHMKQAGPGSAVTNLKSLRMRKPQFGRKRNPAAGYKVSPAAAPRKSPTPAAEVKEVNNVIRTHFRSPTAHLRSPVKNRISRPNSANFSRGGLSPTLSTNSPRRALTPLSVASGGNKTRISENEIRAVLALLDSSPVSRTYSVDTRCVNLSWMKQLADRRSTPGMTHLTLLNMPQELIDEKGDLHERDAITSPRSAYVLLSSGTSVHNLQILPDNCFGNSSNSNEAKQLHEESRVRLLRSLQDQYRTLSDNQSLEEVVACVMRRTADDGGQFTAVQRRKEQSSRLLSACKRRLERHEEIANTARQSEYFAEQERAKRVSQMEDEKKKRQRDLSKRLEESARRKEERREELQQKMEEDTKQISERLMRLHERDETRKLLNQERSESVRRIRETRQQQKMEQFARNKQNNDDNIQDIRQRAELKSRQAEERKREHDFLKQQQKEQQTQQMEVVAERRKEHLQKSLEAANEKRDAAIQKQQLAEFRSKQRQEAVEMKKRARKEQEQLLGQKREEKKEASHVMELERAEDYRHKNVEKKRDFEIRRKEREQMSSYQRQIQSAENADRSLKVLCQGRANEFRKALIQQDIDQKAARVDAANEIKDKMIRECWKEREMLRREKEAIIDRNLQKQQKEKISLK